jgi:uncharacterized protein
MTSIYVDADACPVKNEILRVAERHALKVFVVSNGGVRPYEQKLVETIVVANIPDAADSWIVDHVKAADIVVTADIPLAAKCLNKGAQVLGHNGEPFTESNIGNRLATRELMTSLRGADPFFQNKSNSFLNKDRSRFLEALEKDVRFALRKKS